MRTPPARLAPSVRWALVAALLSVVPGLFLVPGATAHGTPQGLHLAAGPLSEESPLHLGGPVPPAPHAVTNATGNLSAVLNRGVILVGIAASGVITLVWSRVAISWFSHDPTKKVQAKERARDALVGSMVLLAAVSGLAWGLAHWVLTGT